MDSISPELRSRLVAFARSVLVRPQDAEDAVHEAILRAATATREITQGDYFRLTKWCAGDINKRRAQRVEFESQYTPPENQPWLLERMIEQLPTAEMKEIMLLDVSGCSETKMVELTGNSRRTVAAILSSGRTALRKMTSNLPPELQPEISSSETPTD